MTTIAERTVSQDVADSLRVIALYQQWAHERWNVHRDTLIKVAAEPGPAHLLATWLLEAAHSAESACAAYAFACMELDKLAELGLAGVALEAIGGTA